MSDGFRARRDDFLLGCDEAVAARIVSIGLWTRRSNIAMPLWVISKSAGAIFFGVECQILLYDSTSTYF